MAEIIEVLRDHVPAYPIVLSGSFEELPGALKPLGLEKRKVCIVTDSRVAEILADGNERARAFAARTLDMVRERMGL